MIKFLDSKLNISFRAFDLSVLIRIQHGTVKGLEKPTYLVELLLHLLKLCWVEVGELDLLLRHYTARRTVNQAWILRTKSKADRSGGISILSLVAVSRFEDFTAMQTGWKSSDACDNSTVDPSCPLPILRSPRFIFRLFHLGKVALRDVTVI